MQKISHNQYLLGQPLTRDFSDPKHQLTTLPVKIEAALLTGKKKTVKTDLAYVKKM